MGLCSQKYNKLVTVDLHYLIMIIIIKLSPLIFLFIFIPHPLQSQSTFYNHLSTQTPLPVLFLCQWLADGCLTAVDAFANVGKLKSSHIPRDFIVST